jgi:hypothetical protein
MSTMPFFLLSLLGGGTWWVVPLVLAMGLWWIMGIIEIARGDFEKENDKIIWLLIVLLLGFLGLLIYRIAGPRPYRN